MVAEPEKGGVVERDEGVNFFLSSDAVFDVTPLSRLSLLPRETCYYLRVQLKMSNRDFSKTARRNTYF